jgi:agarase
MKLRFAVVAATALYGVAAMAVDYDTYGGWTKLHGRKTGFFHTEQIDGRWWLVTPAGNVFLSKGVDHVNYAPESDSAPKAPSDTTAWAKMATAQLHLWGFNTVGAWSAKELHTAGIAYAPIVDIAAAVALDVWLKGLVVDYFSAEFREAADRAAARTCVPHADDPWLLGYFTDNELRWGCDWRGKESLLESYLKMPSSSTGYARAVAFLKEPGRGASVLTDNDKSAFLELVAAEYARVSSDAIRRHDSNHLILGCRFASYAGDAVMRGVGSYFDVISFHSYSPNAPIDRLELIHKLTGKPTMVTEFSFKAMDSGLPNTKGAAKPVATQDDRAQASQRMWRRWRRCRVVWASTGSSIETSLRKAAAWTAKTVTTGW